MGGLRIRRRLRACPLCCRYHWDDPLESRKGSVAHGQAFRRCCSMAIMATEVDPAGMMPGTILKSADFREARVLEIGAGDGRLTLQYAAEPRSIVAIDNKELDIRAASEHRGLELCGDVQFLCASATALPFSA